VTIWFYLTGLARYWASLLWTRWGKAVLLFYGLLSLYDIAAAQILNEILDTNLPILAKVLGLARLSFWTIVGLLLLLMGVLESGYGARVRKGMPMPENRDALIEVATRLQVSASKLIDRWEELNDEAIENETVTSPFTRNSSAEYEKADEQYRVQTNIAGVKFRAGLEVFRVLIERQIRSLKIENEKVQDLAPYGREYEIIAARLFAEARTEIDNGLTYFLNALDNGGLFLEEDTNDVDAMALGVVTVVEEAG
jgi:hypothetical protein